MQAFETYKENIKGIKYFLEKKIKKLTNWLAFLFESIF